MNSNREPSARAPITPYRAALSAILSVATAVGLAPYLLFIDRLAWLTGIAPIAAILAFATLRKQKTNATAHPSFAEWLMGSWSAVGMPAIASLVGMMLFGLGYGAAWLILGAAGYLGFTVAAEPSAWGFWISVWMVAIMAIVVPIGGAKDLFRALYPPEAWSRTAFFPQLARRKLFAALAAAAIAGLVAMIWFLDWRGTAFPVLLSLLFSYTSFPLSALSEKKSDKSETRVVDVLASLLTDARYRVVRAPRTGRAEIDPLLQVTDLLAKSHARGYAFQVKVVEPLTEVEWNEATAVRTAAALLSQEPVAQDDSLVPVDPVLMVVGGTLGQSLQAFCQRERVTLVHFESATAATRDTKELARRLQAAGVVLGREKPLQSTAT